MNLQISGNTEISQFVVSKDGLYAWRNKSCKNTNGGWIIGLCKIGDKINGQYEGCGPITFEAKEK